MRALQRSLAMTMLPLSCRGFLAAAYAGTILVPHGVAIARADRLGVTRLKTAQLHNTLGLQDARPTQLCGLEASDDVRLSACRVAGIPIGLVANVIILGDRQSVRIVERRTSPNEVNADTTTYAVGPDRHEF